MRKPFLLQLSVYLAVLLGFLAACATAAPSDTISTAVATQGSALDHCGEAPRLVPDDYTANATQFDVICLPEAWHFMQDKWQSLQNDYPNWPYLVVIDDGFFFSDDGGPRPDIHPGYPDGSRIDPQGTARGDEPQSGQIGRYGYHGTAVLSLLTSDANNGLLIAGVSGPWSNTPRGREWGARFLPVRI